MSLQLGLTPLKSPRPFKSQVVYQNFPIDTASLSCLLILTTIITFIIFRIIPVITVITAITKFPVLRHIQNAAQYSGISLGKQLDGQSSGLSGGGVMLKNHQDSVYHGGNHARVRKSDHRRRVNNDILEIPTEVL